jgi:hypothetical protein
MQQTISENFNSNLLDTFSVSCKFCTTNVKILLNMNNPQVTKAFNSLVGTSEAICLLNLNILLKQKQYNLKTFNFSTKNYYNNNKFSE